MEHDTIARNLSAILNAEKVGKSTIMITPTSKLMISILELMKEHRYIGDFEKIENGKGGIIKVNLLGAINNCGVIKPRFSVKVNEYIKFEKRYLPARNVGLLIVSTSKGIMTNTKSKSLNLGGKLIAYAY